MAKKKLSRNERLKKLRKKLDNTDMGGSKGFFTPKQGNNIIRILPEVGEMEFFFQHVGKHYFGKKSAYCPRNTSDGELDCPICEIVSDLYKDGSKAAKQMASDLRVRKAFWMNVIDRSNESLGPLIYTPGVMVMGGISAIIGDPDWGDIDDVDEGVDITIDRSGTGMDTEYQVNPKRHDSPLSKDGKLAKKWLDEAKDLSYVEVSDDPEEDKDISAGHALYVLPYDRIIDEYDLDNLFDTDGVEVSDDPEEDEDDEEEYEDDDEDEPDEEVEEEPTPREEIKKRKARRRRRRKK